MDINVTEADILNGYTGNSHNPICLAMYRMYGRSINTDLANGTITVDNIVSVDIPSIVREFLKEYEYNVFPKPISFSIEPLVIEIDITDNIIKNVGGCVYEQIRQFMYITYGYGVSTFDMDHYIVEINCLEYQFDSPLDNISWNNSRTPFSVNAILNESKCKGNRK